MSKFVMKTDGDHVHTYEGTDRFCSSRADQFVDSLESDGVEYEYTESGEGEDTEYVVDQKV